MENLKNIVAPGRRKGLSELRSRTDVKLHWGCGAKHHDGWVNVDGWSSAATDCVVDMRKKLPLGDGSTKLIFTEHVMEHFYHEDVRQILADFYRILQPGGVARIIVPSLSIFCQRYQERAPDFMREFWPNCANDGEILNYVFYGHFHRTIFDFEMLRHDLSQVGFSDVRNAQFRDSDIDALNLDTDHPSRLICSLYVEARK